MNNKIYQSLCTEYYELDKPHAPADALQFYLKFMKQAEQPILEPMCGTGRFLIPALEYGIEIEGLDASPHMLEVCKKKCTEKQLNCTLYQESIEAMQLNKQYGLIFIPAGSFGLLTTKDQAKKALNAIYQHLKPGGSFICEIETIHNQFSQPDIWHGSCIKRNDGSLLVASMLFSFNPQEKVETVLQKYEVWENNTITQTEVEKLGVRLYEPCEFDLLLKEASFKNIKRLEPYTQDPASDQEKELLYMCQKA